MRTYVTRINCVPVETLSNAHAMAEYKEITRPFNKVAARLEKGQVVPTLNGDYRLGKGHETFFFNKLQYLHKRRAQLYFYLTDKLGYNLEYNKFITIQDDFERTFCDNPDLFKDWTPTANDMYINMARLCHRHFKTDLSEYR